jgi:hypothetical protein
MPALTRRRDPEARQESWRVFYGDVQVGTIGLRSGVPMHAEPWHWSCRFYPVSHRGLREDGIAPAFSTARSDFESAWSRLLPKITDADLSEYRRECAWIAWKYGMWDCGCKLPTQEPSGLSRCFCGTEIGIVRTRLHVYAVHMLS